MDNLKLITDIFKFVAVRPAQLPEPNTLDASIGDARASTPDGSQQLDALAARISSPESAMQAWSEIDLSRFDQFAEIHRTLLNTFAPTTTIGLGDDDIAADPPSPAAVLANSEISTLSHTQWAELSNAAFDALYVAHNTGPDAGARLEAPTSVLRVLNFARLARDGRVKDAEQATRALNATVFVPAKLYSSSVVSAPQNPPNAAPGNQPAQESDATRKKRQLLDEFQATKDLLESIRAASPLLKPRPQVSTDPNTPQELRARISISASPRIRDALANNMTDTSQQVMRTLSISENTTLPSASLALERHLTTLTNTAYSMSGDLEFQTLAKNKAVSELIPIFLPRFDPSVDPSSTADVNMSGKIKPLGIGDLKVVKQKLLSYVPGEVAHVENVLKGEYKDRKHRVLDRAETMVFTSEEESQETERDTQSTERFELKREAEAVIKEDMSVQAGLKVTSGFGPVTITAHGDFAYSTSKQDSVRTSSNFAKEVVDRAVTRVQKKTKVERTTKTLHEVEETNNHGLDNKLGAAHITGVYRWVDKRYRAQVYNYGRRLMIEFIVPEPAAFFRTSQMKSPLELAGVAPPHPFVNINGDPLVSSDIREYNYQIFASRYNAAGVTPPPPSWTYITTTFDQGDIENGKTISKSVKDLIVPEGYMMRFVNAQVSLVWVAGAPQFLIQIGEWAYHMLKVTLVKQGVNELVGPAPAPELWDDPSGTVPVSIVGYDINAYAVNVSANCERTREHYEKWQLATFDKIYNAYKALQSEYDQKLAQAKAQIGAVIIRGRNPEINRDIEQNELKKLAITMLTGQHFGFFDAMTDPAGQPEKYPEVRPLEALNDGRYVQFFEQAFDWTQMTYLFFPYFWGRKRNWIKVSNETDSDPQFMQFLQAGAARVLVPVSPAYNKAVLYFLQSTDTDVSKKLWQGGDPPLLDDPLYKSIADELKAKTDDLAGATPEGEPWEFTIPTTLVWLQEGPELPVFET